MTQSKQWWNERTGYHAWGSAEYTNPKTYEDFADLIDRCDDSVKAHHLKALLKEAERVLEQEDIDRLMRYMCYELDYVPNPEVQMYLNIIDIPKVNVLIESKPRGGGYYLLCKRNGIIHRQIITKWNKKKKEYEDFIYDKKILDVPFELKNLYLSQNDLRFYEVNIGKEEVCLNKEDLLNFVQKERNYAYISGRQLFDCLSIVLRAYEKKKNLKEKRMYPAIGVFQDKRNNLIVVYPSVPDIVLYGENGYQKRTIKRCEQIGLDIDGDLAESYYHMIHDEYYPESVRLGIAGHCITAPFYYVLKDVLDVFPNHHWIAPPTGIGKTDLNQFMYNFLFGIEIKSNDDVSSGARLSKISTAYTMATYIDDIDDLPEEAMSYMKFLATRFKSRDRMDNQKVIFEDTYSSFCGSANVSNYISGNENEAYRNRCLINMDFNKHDTLKGSPDFDKHKEKIIHGSIFGYYALSKIFEFIDERIPDEFLNSYQKLRELFKFYKSELRVFLQKNKILLVDSRRLTIYTLLHMGLRFWNYIFLSKGLESELLINALDYENNDIFINLIRKYEGNLMQISIDQFISILNYYELYWSTHSGLNLTDNEDNPVLTTDFIHEYDKFAKQRGYDSLKSLTTLADMQMKVLREDVKTTTVCLKEKGALNKDKVYGLVFKIDMIKKVLDVESNPLTKRDPNEPREGIKKLEQLLVGLKEAFEYNNNIDLEKKNLIQTLQLTTDLNEEYIKNAIEEMIIEGNLKVVSGGKINFNLKIE